MATITITIADKGDELTMEGRLETPEALNEPPTAALIVGTYLAAHAEVVCKDAVRWFTARSAQSEPEPVLQEPQLKLVLPGDRGLS